MSRRVAEGKVFWEVCGWKAFLRRIRMTKKTVFVLVLITAVSFFAAPQSFRLDGNAHIFSYNDLKSILAKDHAHYTANELYRSYQSLRESCGSNSLLLEQKEKNEFANQAIRISGTVARVRRSFFDEYIVELNTSDAWGYDVGVVYPKKISAAMVRELIALQEGQHFECVVITRKNSMFVDVPVWNQNGVYRTEP